MPSGYVEKEAKAAAHICELLKSHADPQSFQFAVELFNQAAAGRVSGSHIPPPLPGAGGFHLTDVPINRGMLAISREFQHLDINARMALVMRVSFLLDTAQALRGDERFQQDIISDADGLLISERFIDAFGRCDFIAPSSRVQADLNDLLHKMETPT